MHLLRKLLFLVLQGGAVPTKAAHALAATPTCKTQTLKNDGAKKIFGMSLLQAPMASARQAVPPERGKREIRSRDDDDDDFLATEAELQELERLSSDLMTDPYPTRQRTEGVYSTTASPELLLEQIPTNPSPGSPGSLVSAIVYPIFPNLLSFLRTQFSLSSLENGELTDGWRIVIAGFSVLPLVICFSTCLRAIVTWLITLTCRQYFKLIIFPSFLVWAALTIYFWRWEKSGSLTRALQDPMVMTVIVIATFVLPFTFLITFVIYKWLKPYLFAALDVKRKCIIALEKFIQRDLDGDGKIETTFAHDFANFLKCGSKAPAAAPAAGSGDHAAHL
eukprot:TRINITY_DN91507_c0_g1_i1.p1 TRINITY_DN91507_c0_g1~~TRINITY_DN91507_c0_g1_i1.p1  ORF type:complete len:335 (-),score=36.89 TRINITY_DN91507_c0_g1_i1:102-1106(-)